MKKGQIKVSPHLASHPRIYACCGASTGHTFAQAPHSMHASASITYMLSPAEIHDTGHSDSHAPQLMQESLIT